MTTTRPRFHLAFPVHDLERARGFYAGLLGCATGRESSQWIDFDFYGHQIVAHLDSDANAGVSRSNVDGDAVPVRHFGVILDLASWQTLADRLKGSQVRFLIEPRVRFAGQPGEQATMFFLDPSGNALEIKAFADDSQIFAR